MFMAACTDRSSGIFLPNFAKMMTKTTRFIVTSIVIIFLLYIFIEKVLFFTALN